MNNRRNFLKLSGGVAGSLLVSRFSGASLLASCGHTTDNSKKPFGLQLYTLRDVLPADPKGILKQVAAFGYKQIESYEGNQGMFWGMSNTAFKTYIDELGMTMVSSHYDIDKDFDRKAAEAAAIGMKYLICPYKGEQTSLDAFKKIAIEFNLKGEICKKYGLRFAYHNHGYSFKKLEGQYPQDVMMTETDPDLVDFEMDIYWVVVAGEDPAAWLKKYPKRFRLCHVKDYSKTPVTNNSSNSVNLGTGTIDFGSILKAAKANGMQYYIVEQESYPSGNSLQAAKADAAYMKELSW